MRNQKYLHSAIKQFSEKAAFQNKEADDKMIKLSTDAISRKIKHQRDKDNLTYAFNNEYKVREYIFEILC